MAYYSGTPNASTGNIKASSPQDPRRLQSPLAPPRKGQTTMKRITILFLALALSPSAGLAGWARVLWYSEPANNNKHMEQSLPLGNGRMGCLMSGGMARERIQFNEQSLWSGDNNWDGAYECGDHGFGAFRNFGDLVITWNAGGVDSTGGPSIPADYRRELNLNTGIHRTTFTQGGVTFTREAFASHPDQVMVFRYTANKPGALSGKIAPEIGPGGQKPGDGARPLFRRRNAQQAQACLRRPGAAHGRHRRGRGRRTRLRPLRHPDAASGCPNQLQARLQGGWRGADPLPLVEKELAAAKPNPTTPCRSQHIADLSATARPRHSDNWRQPRRRFW